MKLVMVVCSDNRADEIRDLITRHDVHAYSELHEVTGSGEKGIKSGDRIWPGKSVIVFTVVSEEKKTELLQALKGCKETLLPEESLRAFVMPVEEAL